MSIQSNYTSRRFSYILMLFVNFGLHFVAKIDSKLESDPDECVAFESSYHIENNCQCIVYESNGGSQGMITSPVVQPSGISHSVNLMATAFVTTAGEHKPVVMTSSKGTYPSGVPCILYTFIGDIDEIVEITFVEFDLEPVDTLTGRCADYVRMFLDLERPEIGPALITTPSRGSDRGPGGRSTGSGRNVKEVQGGELCGNRSAIQQKHYSSKRSLIIEFHTDTRPSNHTGFTAQYRFIDKGQFQMTSGSKRWGSNCSYDFTSTKNRKKGVVYSPRYPQHYPHNVHCLYYFHGQTGETVQLNFTSVQLAQIPELTVECGDSILVSEAGDNSSAAAAGSLRSTLTRYCSGSKTITVGQRIEIEDKNVKHQREDNQEQWPLVSVMSSGAELLVEFISDSFYSDQGFAAKFEFIPQGALKRASSAISREAMDRHWTETLTDTPVTQSCNEEYLSHRYRSGIFTNPGPLRESPPHSVGVMSSRSGAIVTCRYLFHGQGRERVRIQFTHLDLHYPYGDPMHPTECNKADRITVLIVVDGTTRDIAVYCGRQSTTALMSASNRLEIVFTSVRNAGGDLPYVAENRDKINGLSYHDVSRFTANFSFVTDFGIQSSERDESTVCGFFYRSTQSSSGSFTSPNYPGLYPRLTVCHYRFYGLPEERVQINFTYLDIDGNMQKGCAVHSIHFKLGLLSVNSCQADLDGGDYVELSNYNIDVQSDTDHVTRLCGRSQAASKGATLRRSGRVASKSSESSLHQRAIAENHPVRTIVSDGNFFRVTFRSNHINDGTGFRAVYQFTADGDANVHRSADTMSHQPLFQTAGTNSFNHVTLLCAIFVLVVIMTTNRSSESILVIHDVL